jgi:hypothetical protein
VVCCQSGCELWNLLLIPNTWDMTKPPNAEVDVSSYSLLVQVQGALEKFSSQEIQIIIVHMTIPRVQIVSYGAVSMPL